ncbi:beta-1,6-N-acetylglucosaminyltransferase [Iningainema tapete]|uniref:Peptide O-xylosyltransferase n=1 Tax=Iningainema tapete BLCC-T55 TaxID=2748662 RepID=A0A8J6XDT0_9CYAN|nr:beta-1,6-N-acetylglucosaminyltransferase [Iningainema tapete]MBD2771728.1 N-acetylglucosaminyltransferase [Iningainema tapete BLCC-T55]
MKVCYFIQTHKNPQQIYRLVRTIKNSSPTAQILIGHDFTSSSLDITPLQDLSDVHLLKIQFRPLRGDFSLIQPYLNAINWLLEHNSDFDWLVYLSGQDYPTQSLAESEAFLAQTEYDGFIRYWDVFSEECPWDKEKVLERYFYKYWRIPGRYTYNLLLKIQKLWLIKLTPLKFYLTYGPLVGLPSKSTPFKEQFICYGGRQWHTLSRKCTDYIRQFIQTNPHIVSYYQKTVCSDESFIQTVLVNSKKFNLCNDDKRFIEIAKTWGGHPRILTKQDYATLTNSSYHFARKFDPKADVEILNMLDDFIIN